MLTTGVMLQNRYRIVSLLGQGGMGAVYRAWDTRLNAPVALKEMTPQPGLDADILNQLRQQFQREANIFAAVYSIVQENIGCATGSIVSGLVVEENFERGRMFWREPIDQAQALVLFNNGAWRVFEHSPFIEGSPEFSCPDANTPERCPPTPKRGFGMMWCDIPEIRNGLGNATDCERGYQGAMQQFERGFMLQTDSGAIYVFYNSGTWEHR